MPEPGGKPYEPTVTGMLNKIQNPESGIANEPNAVRMGRKSGVWSAARYSKPKNVRNGTTTNRKRNKNVPNATIRKTIETKLDQAERNQYKQNEIQNRKRTAQWKS